ncbi:MAG: hypothetical protein J6A85_02690 [Clostridia bacterium]|nr:hypothetical protein [Clostridia bacterium]
MRVKNALLLVLALLLFTVSLSGCDSEKSTEYPEKTLLPVDKMIAESETHQYFRSGDKYYLHYSKDYTSDDEVYYSLAQFDSYENMILCLTEDLINIEHLRPDSVRKSLQGLFGDENGDIQVVNVNDLRWISASDYTFYSIKLGENGGYTIELLRNGERNVYLDVTVFCDKTSFDQAISDELKIHSSDKLTDTVQTDDGKTEIYITDFDKFTDEFRYRKRTCYNLDSEDGRRAYVIETRAGVFEEGKDELEYSKDARTNVVFLEDSGEYYKIYVGWRNEYPDFEEWLFSLKFEQYDSEKHSVTAEPPAQNEG